MSFRKASFFYKQRRAERLFPDDELQQRWHGYELRLMADNFPLYDSIKNMSKKGLKRYLEICWQDADDAWDLDSDSEYWHIVAHLKWLQAWAFLVTGVFLHPSRNIGDTPHQYAVRLEQLLKDALEE